MTNGKDAVKNNKKTSFERLDKIFGCHCVPNDEGFEYSFKCFFPGADAVSVVGDFNGWTGQPMKRICENVWETTVCSDSTLEGTKYKYLVLSGDKTAFFTDFFAKQTEKGGQGATEIFTADSPVPIDREWHRRQKDRIAQENRLAFPINIYELHFGLWRDGCCDTNELALYLRQIGCTHAAFVSVTDRESPFAVTSEYGGAPGFAQTVSILHKKGIGAIVDLDITPSGATDEISDVDIVITKALYFICDLHADGVKLVGFSEGMNGALRQVYETVKEICPEALIISENDGFGCADLYYNNEWTDNTLAYCAIDPLYRKSSHHRLAEPQVHRISKPHILAFSRSGELCAEKSLLDNNFGSYDMKFAGTRLLRMYQMTYPGKKLAFMGTEYGPFKKWDGKSPLEWFMLDFERHKQLLDFTAELGNFYLSEPALWERDMTADGFEWIYPDMSELNVIAYRRIAENGDELTVILNFSPIDRYDFTLINCKYFSYKEIFSSDCARYGGLDMQNRGLLETFAVHDGTRSLKLTLPGLSAVVLKPVGHIS